MTLREQIVEKIKNMPEQGLDELLKVVEDIELKKAKPNAMAQLRQIKISAAPDLSTNAEIYPIVKRDEQ